MPQRTDLGPLIFNLYIKDLSKQLADICKVVQYADATLVFCNHHYVNFALQHLQDSSQIFLLFHRKIPETKDC